MGKEEVMSQKLEQIHIGSDQVLSQAIGESYDIGKADGIASVPQGGGGFSQEQMDAFAAQKVSDALAADQVGDDANIQAVKDKAALDLAVVQSDLDKKNHTIDSLKQAKEKLASILADLSSIANDEPAPPPAPPSEEPPVSEPPAEQPAQG